MEKLIEELENKKLLKFMEASDFVNGKYYCNPKWYVEEYYSHGGAWRNIVAISKSVLNYRDVVKYVIEVNVEHDDF